MTKLVRRQSDVAKTGEPASTSASQSVNAGTRILRSSFRRGADVTWCELRLAEDGSAYELRMQGNQHEVVERFADAMAAFDRHGSIERALVADGWTLEAFEAEAVQREKMP